MEKSAEKHNQKFDAANWMMRQAAPAMKLGTTLLDVENSGEITLANVTTGGVTIPTSTYYSASSLTR